MSSTRPEVTDDRGVIHRHGCPKPGWTVETSHALPAWRLVRCAGCGIFRTQPGSSLVAR